MTSKEWSLGDDSDCDTCGWSYNTVGLELWDEEEGIWQLYMRVGCYGGMGALSTESHWESQVEEIIESSRQYSDFGKAEEKELREMLKLVKVKK